MFSVRLFHKFVNFKLKKLFLTFNLEYDLANFRLCPLVTFVYMVVNTVLQLYHTFHLKLTYVSIMSPRDLLYTRCREIKISQSVLIGQMLYIFYYFSCSVLYIFNR